MTVAILRGGNQFDFADFAHAGFAQQQAACIALPAAQRAQIFIRCLVIVGIKTTDHAFAAGRGDAHPCFHVHRHARFGFAA